MLDMIIYNPFTWVISLLFFGCVFSYVYWYCKRNFELKGSWKHLDKSIHWRRQMDEYQGKRKEQVEYSEKVAAGSMILMIIIMFIGWVISTI